MVATSWSSLEIAKLAVGISTPVLVALIGFVINRSVRRLEDAQWANRKLIERRLELFDEIAPRLNDVYCFFHVVGGFREISPPDALALKRDLDKLYHVNRYLFAPEFAELYERFMRLCFRTFTGTGEPAKIRSSIVLQREERQRAQWDTAWEPLFDPETQPALAPGDRDELEAAYRWHGRFVLALRQAYSALMDEFADELGVHADAHRTGRTAGRHAAK